MVRKLEKELAQNKQEKEVYDEKEKEIAQLKAIIRERQADIVSIVYKGNADIYISKLDFDCETM